jgi:hypothetical protein
MIAPILSDQAVICDNSHTNSVLGDFSRHRGRRFAFLAERQRIIGIPARASVFPRHLSHDDGHALWHSPSSIRVRILNQLFTGGYS